jgi:hypothetical protein
MLQQSQDGSVLERVQNLMPLLVFIGGFAEWAVKYLTK